MNSDQVNQVVQGLTTFHWNNGFAEFCKMIGIEPESLYAREKYGVFSEMMRNIAQFDVESLTKLINHKGS